MIQELKITNFLSFKDEVIFNFEATKDTMFDESHVVEVAKGVRLLRFALVYGANASGKSNLLNAFDFLYRFWFHKAADVDEPTHSIPFMLDRETPSKPSKFELKFYVGGVKYWYILDLDEKRVYEEKLFRYRSAQPTMLFLRAWREGQSIIIFNNAAVKVSKAAQDEISLKCLPNMSVFAARDQVNVSIPEIDAAKEWMKTRMMPAVNSRSQMMGCAGQKMKDDLNFKSYLLDFIHRADFNITGIHSDDKNPSIDGVETTFEHTVRNSRGQEKYAMPAFLQSDGTTRTIGIETAIYSAIENEAFLHIDEIEASLHPDLVEFIIQKFLSVKNRSQLLVTTHYDSLLNTVDDLIRKDSVWFTEKDERGSTNLYSLVEFKGLGRISSLQKAYRNGVFGALPMIKD